MKHLFSLLAVGTLVAGCGGSDKNANLAGGIDRFEIVSTADAYGGVKPAGATGPYSVITAIVHGRLNPKHADNAGIVDLANARTDAEGYVNYTTDVVILRPKLAADARRVLFYDVVNRGNKVAQSAFIGGGGLTTGAAPDDTFPSILRAGYTVVWSGWQGDIAQSGDGVAAAIGATFPTATNSDGTSITGLSREEFVPDFAGGGTTIPLTYPPASLTDKSDVKFTARQSWLNSDGKQDYAAPSSPVTTWSYIINAERIGVGPVHAACECAGDERRHRHRAARCRNDLLVRLPRQGPEGHGHRLCGGARPHHLPEKLERRREGQRESAERHEDRACAAGANCPANPATNYDVALGEGVSQSGRFLRDFLYQGFNKDANGGKVFDGLMPIIPAARRTWVNSRFAQAGRWSKQHEDHWMPGDQFPFTYATITDPVSGLSDGLLKSCTVTNTCPKIMQIDGSFEWWGGRASLVVTDGAGRDVALPDNVRYYLVAGTQHGGGAGVTTGIVTQPTAGNVCQFAASPVSQTPVARALIPALEAWVVKNTAPPASQHPTVAAGTLAKSDRLAVGFPDLSNVTVPNGPSATSTALSVAYSGQVNQLFVTDYTSAEPKADLTKQYTLLVPKVDANGNETSGIRMPEVAVPLATYTGWNLRSSGHAMPENCTFIGSAIPFATSPATKAGSDPRTTVATLYTGRADYQAKFGAAADALVTQGFLTDLDATNVYKAGAASVSSALIPAP